MSMNYLTEAFKELELLEGRSFSFNEEGAAKMANFLEDDVLDDFETIIDPEAESEEELKPTYVGNVILGCETCHSMIYKAADDVVVDEETQLANVGELCPYCFTTDGFKLIGKVAPFEEVTVDVQEKEEVDGAEVSDTEASDELTEAKITISRAEMARLDKEVEEAGKEVAQYNIPVKQNSAGETEPDFSVVPEEKREAAMKAYDRYAKAVAARPSRSKDIITYTESLEEDACPHCGEDIEDYKPHLSKKVWGKNDFSIFCTTPSGMGRATNDVMRLGADELHSIYVSTKTPQEFASKCDMSVVKGTSDGSYLFKKKDSYGNIHFVHVNLRDGVLTEGMENISITTDNEVITVNSTVRPEKEEIAPLADEEVEEIVASQEETEMEETEMVEAPIEEEETVEEPVEEVEIEEIDEEGFDNLGESYLKKVYENVESFKTVAGKRSNGKIILEGVIKFNSGKKAKTSFIFESKELTKRGKLRLFGENVNIATSKGAFILTGKTEGKKLICEAFTYNYNAKDAKTGASKKLYGTVRK